MFFPVLSVALPLLLSSPQVSAESLAANYVGTDFLSAFSWQAIADPTHGRVNYLSQSDALSKNLTYASGNTFIMRADSTTTLSASGPGRNSVRIQSNAQYTNHVVVLDLRHMPDGCATWPAFWEVGDNWPNNGEVDIIEGVNGVGADQSTLHTSPGCTINGATSAGTSAGTDCAAADNGNAGCGSKPNAGNSFGAGFNNNGGGFYAMQRTGSSIKIWFWARNGSPPGDISSNTGSVNPGAWGTPYADFETGSGCNLSSKFGPNNIVFDLTFCGDWAGAVFASQGCGSDCTSFVNSNPGAFANAYWDVARLSVYE